MGFLEEKVHLFLYIEVYTHKNNKRIMFALL